MPSRDVDIDTVQHHWMEDKLTAIEKQILGKEIRLNNKVYLIIIHKICTSFMFVKISL